MRRRLLILAAFALAVVSATGTGGFSAAQMDRGVSVAVAPDSDAILGIKTYDQTADDAGKLDPGRTKGETGPPTEVVLLEVTNRTGQDIESIDVDIDEPDEPNERRPPKVMDAGASYVGDDIWEVQADVVCGSEMSETWTVDLTIQADGVQAELSRSVDVACDSQPSTDTST
jgi:hypothetical protein